MRESPALRPGQAHSVQADASPIRIEAQPAFTAFGLPLGTVTPLPLCCSLDNMKFVQLINTTFRALPKAQLWGRRERLKKQKVRSTIFPIPCA
jgi:hypothetical protein